MKEFKNYLEQVNYNVSDRVLFNEYTNTNEYYYDQEDFQERMRPDFEEILQEFNEQNNSSYKSFEDMPEDTQRDFSDFEIEYSEESINQTEIYQFYVVSLKWDYNDEAKRLGVFYDPELDLYILPVTHFGTSWDYVGPVSFNY